MLHDSQERHQSWQDQNFRHMNRPIEYTGFISKIGAQQAATDHDSQELGAKMDSHHKIQGQEE